MTNKVKKQNNSDQDFTWAFYLNRKCLEPVGVWPNDGKESRLERLWLPLILMIILCCHCTPVFYAFLKLRHHLHLVLDNILHLMASWIPASKVFFLWYHLPVYKMLIKWSQTDWSRRTEDWERKLMFKQAQRGRFISTFSYMSSFIHLTNFLIAPVFDFRLRIINNITDPDPTHFLPSSTYYPYEFHKSPYYELTYLSQIIAMTLSTIAYTAVDSFFSVLVFHASGQSEILTERMNRLYDEEGPHFRDKVHELIEFHDYLIRFVKAIDKSFNIIIMIHFLGTMITICSVGYAFIKAVNGIPSVLQFLLFTASIIDWNEHIFTYCLTAEVLVSNSSEIFNGIYSANWYNIPAKKAKYVVAILARSQCPLQLSVGGFFYLSLNSYVQIMKSIASYISMLLAVS